MSVKDDLREQFTEAFEGADYPVNNQMDLVPALPDGPSTKFSAGDVNLTAMELATKLGNKASFPYEDVESLVEDIMSSLEEEDIV